LTLVTAGRVVGALGPGERVGAGRHDRVLAGEEAAQQVGGGPIGRGPRVEAPEDELHDLARDLRGDDALGRRVERPDVQGARDEPGRRGDAVGGRDEHVGARERRVGVVDEADALEQVGAQRRRRRRPALGVHDGLPAQPGAEPA